MNKAWLDFDYVVKNEMDKIHQAASLAVTAKRAGHNTYIFSDDHSTLTIVPCQHNTGLLAQMNYTYPGTGTTGYYPGITPQAGDFVMLICYDSLFLGPSKGNVVDSLRAVGAVLVHCLTDYDSPRLQCQRQRSLH